MSPVGKEELIETLLSQNKELTETIASLRRIVQESNQTNEPDHPGPSGPYSRISSNQQTRELPRMDTRLNPSARTHSRNSPGLTPAPNANLRG